MNWSIFLTLPPNLISFISYHPFVHRSCRQTPCTNSGMVLQFGNVSSVWFLFVVSYFLLLILRIDCYTHATSDSHPTSKEPRGKGLLLSQPADAICGQLCFLMTVPQSRSIFIGGWVDLRRMIFRTCMLLVIHNYWAFLKNQSCLITHICYQGEEVGGLPQALG